CDEIFGGESVYLVEPQALENHNGFIIRLRRFIVKKKEELLNSGGDD
ncbi:unnamed protein product, partial [Microthlaspi erraticum]